jgi:transglutaminase-like putative cysteine protease
MPGGHVHLAYQARVALSDQRTPPLPSAPIDVLRLPPETLLYTLPSRYCPSDRLLKMAADEFGAAEPGFPQVQAICRWIYDHVAYQYGTSDVGTSALDTATERSGVCRDFAHLGIAFCRALSIPARYVSGYCLGLETPDFHAYFEAYLQDRWVAFDATAPEPRRALVQVALGRDAADCAWSTFYGFGETTGMRIEVAETTPR